MSMTTTVEIEGPATVTVKLAVPGQGAAKEVTVEPDAATNVVTVGDVLTKNNVTLDPGQTVSVDGNVVGLDHVIDNSDPSAVHVVLVIPRVNNG